MRRLMILIGFSFILLATQQNKCPTATLNKHLFYEVNNLYTQSERAEFKVLVPYMIKENILHFTYQVYPNQYGGATTISRNVKLKDIESVAKDTEVFFWCKPNSVVQQIKSYNSDKKLVDERTVTLDQYFTEIKKQPHNKTLQRDLIECFKSYQVQLQASSWED